MENESSDVNADFAFMEILAFHYLKDLKVDRKNKQNIKCYIYFRFTSQKLFLDWLQSILDIVF